MNWIELHDTNQLDTIKKLSFEKPQVIFKHSTRCSVSIMAKNRLDKASGTDNVDFHYLNLLQHRNISDAISQQFGVVHESPQVLLIKNGNCTFHESHSSIYYDEIVEKATK